jgi:hypothetical protein
LLKIKSGTERLHVVPYSAILNVPRPLAQFVSRLLHLERRARGTRKGRRALSCFAHAVLVLRWFLDATRIDQLARDSGISLSTGYRYLHEGITVLAQAVPDLHEVLDQCREQGMSHLILDGSLVLTDRVAARTEAGHHWWYSGKHRAFGGNIQFLATPDGFPLWTSEVLPGVTHDLTAAREHALPALYKAAADGLPSLGDKAYQGAGIGIHTPIKKPVGGNVLDPDNRTHNALINGLRALGERAMALLKTRWKALHRITLCPWRIGDIVRAALVLTQYEHGRY